MGVGLCTNDALGSSEAGGEPTAVDRGRSIGCPLLSTNGAIVCKDLRRSRMADALGRRRDSAADSSRTRRVESSGRAGKVSTVGEQAGDEPALVKNVRCPEER